MLKYSLPLRIYGFFSPESFSPVQEYDLVLALDDDELCAQIATSVRKKELIGVYIDSSGNVAYTETSAEWFDMGLRSRFGRKIADELKWKNRRTYQEILFGMLGWQFAGEKYWINTGEAHNQKPIPHRIGLEERAGSRWPTKRWHRFPELAQVLKGKGLSPVFFRQRPSLLEFVHDVASCSAIVTGDTLTMHLALALERPTVAIFTCTSPWEIYDYGILQKVISPALKKAFYTQEYILEAVEAVSLESVLSALEKVCPGS